MCLKTHKTRFIFILQKCSIICMHGSDYCYPSTSLDQGLELGGGLGQGCPRVENCSSCFVHCSWSQAQQSRTGWGNSSRRGFPPVLPPTRVPAVLPRTEILPLPWSQGWVQVSAHRDTRHDLNNQTHTVFCAKRVELSRPIPKYSISL